MPQQLKPVDVVIAGGGFVGLTLAKEITARTPLSMVVLERGQAHKPTEYTNGMDELDNALRYRMRQNLAEETATHRHSAWAAAVPIRQYGDFEFLDNASAKRTGHRKLIPYATIFNGKHV